MKIALRHKSEKYRKLEKPCVYSICHTFKTEGIVNKCAADIKPKRKSKVHVVTIPFGKRVSCCDPCKTPDSLTWQRRSSTRLKELGKENKCCIDGC